MSHGKTSYVCVPCRASYKQWHDPERERRCPRCAEPMIHAGSAFAAPRRRDVTAWRVLATLFDAGVGFHKSCCGGPGDRPRTPRETKEWLPQYKARQEQVARHRLREAARRG
ncbi:deoxyxylulose-5-phosphate synthase [Streptomyces sp. NPDC048629]|uniref:deoxyxylulose-5-phosphate synthase n=1 Tax=Streptomyces sp. NPDC048629 TaxID=3154824 RepID=UPI003443CA33